MLFTGLFPNAHQLLTLGAGQSLGVGGDVVSRTSAQRLGPPGAAHPGLLPASAHDLMPLKHISLFFLFNFSEKS